MNKKIKSIEDVVEWQLCTGCGACAFVERDRYEMRDCLELGRRPFLKQNPVPETGEALKCCPGIHLEKAQSDSPADLLPDMMAGWGPVLEVWEGYAAEAAIRNQGSSGGAATALSLFGLEREQYNKVIHTVGQEQRPYLNKTQISESKDQLLEGCGSRYSPSSPCEGLSSVTETSSKFGFVGKPCDVAGLTKVAESRKDISDLIGIKIAFFCAGTPSTLGTLNLLEKQGIENPSLLKTLKYRGKGWPGLWQAIYQLQNSKEAKSELTYAESWGYLQKFRQWRCYICPDHTGEYADIAVGDPWYREVQADEPGLSLIVVRTTKGRQFLKEAVDNGYVTLVKQGSEMLPQSQPKLLKTKGSLWSRLIVLKVFGAATPKYKGYKFYRFWLSELSLKHKFQSFYQTLARVYRKKLNRRLSVKPWEIN